MTVHPILDSPSTDLMHETFPERLARNFQGQSLGREGILRDDPPVFLPQEFDLEFIDAFLSAAGPRVSDEIIDCLPQRDREWL